MADTIGCVGVMNGKDGVRGRYSPFFLGRGGDFYQIVTEKKV